MPSPALAKRNLCWRRSRKGFLLTSTMVRDVLAWFPTGYGKSLCYQLLPFPVLDFNLKRICSSRVKRSVVIVISSLVSLMVDQKLSILYSAAQWKIMNNIIRRVIEHACALLPLQCVPGLIFRASIAFMKNTALGTRLGCTMMYQLKTITMVASLCKIMEQWN